MDANNGYAGHDQGEVSVRSIAKFVAGIVALLAASLGLMWLVFNRFEAREERSEPARPPMAAANPRTQPPEPRLEADPIMGLADFRKAEEALLHSYGWVDPEKGIVRIPVERALELVAKEGLPSRKEPVRK